MLTISLQYITKTPISYYFFKYIFFGTLTTLAFTVISFWNTDTYFSFSNNTLLPTIAVGFIIYTFFTIAFTAITSSVMTLLLISLLKIASLKKYTATGEPLIFGDISHIHHLPLALNYISAKNFAVVVIALFLLLGYNFIFNLPQIRRKWWRYASLLMAFLILGINSQTFAQKAAFSVRNYGLPYYSWDWPYNQKQNGLAIHLIQTGNRPVPVEISMAQRNEFQQYSSEAIPSNNSPQTFIMILCESCWYDDDTFKSTFAPLTKKATASFRGVSSEYGGGTANATFEFITGLPARNPAVSGIVYQEYRDYLSEHNSTLPSHLKLNGIRTESIHNYNKAFWFRNVVEPKLGFERFTGIEDMIYNATDNDYPSDHFLFNHAVSIIKENRASRKLFMHLATMHTHGPYHSRDDDDGTQHYQEKLVKTVNHINEFINEVRSLDPNSIILIYGDHKPSLPKLSHFLNKNKHMQGDVPVLLFDPDTDRAGKAQLELNGKPFYCMSATLSSIYYNMILPTSRYTDKGCKSYDNTKYETLSGSIPAWLYTAALFDQYN